MVWPRARRNLARQPQTSTVADMTSEPISPIAREISGHAASLRSTRTFARRRRCAHREPAADDECRGGRVGALSDRREPEPRAEGRDKPGADRGAEKDEFPP